MQQNNDLKQKIYKRFKMLQWLKVQTEMPEKIQHF